MCAFYSASLPTSRAVSWRHWRPPRRQEIRQDRWEAMRNRAPARHSLHLRLSPASDAHARRSDGGAAWILRRGGAATFKARSRSACSLAGDRFPLCADTLGRATSLSCRTLFCSAMPLQSDTAGIALTVAIVLLQWRQRPAQPCVGGLEPLPHFGWRVKTRAVRGLHACWTQLGRKTRWHGRTAHHCAGRWS